MAEKTKADKDRVERLLALLLLNSLKGATTGEKAYQLNLAGFANVEIADLLETTAASASQAVYDFKKKKGKK